MDLTRNIVPTSAQAPRVVCDPTSEGTSGGFWSGRTGGGAGGPGHRNGPFPGAGEGQCLASAAAGGALGSSNPGGGGSGGVPPGTDTPFEGLDRLWGCLFELVG